MTDSNEREQFDEPLGANPVRRAAGYSEEYQSPPPLPAPGIKQPVKLRPPGHSESRPPEAAPARPSAATAANPASLLLSEGDDEAFIALSDVPDFSDFDFPPEDRKSPPRAPKDAPLVPEPAFRETPRAPFPTAAVEAPPRPSAGPPDTAPAPTKAPRRADLSFESDEALAHHDRTGSLLQTRGLVKIYDGRTVVNGVDIHVRPGEVVGLLGPNGAGKTTSFYMIVGLVPPNGGQVLFKGHDVTKMPMYQRARLGMGYLPQEESIFRKLTVEENLLAVLETLDLPRKERLARCQELLERFSITHIRKNVALTCSGGEKRRLTIARSLVTTPNLLMLDEPFSGVDPIAVNEIQNIVDDLRRSGLAILITDHNARQTLELVDRAYLIYEGRVLREGTRDFLINDPVSRELYLGDRFTM